jgi:putative oxygen-independent coproporphyrinogen III oxidase
MNSPLPGLYVHVPFCRSKCMYCDFYSIADCSLIPAWLKAIATEISLYSEIFSSFDSLYLGGGTPSVLEESELASLMEIIQQSFSLDPASEITLEANPDDVTPEKLHGYRRLGINRLSLGVQSFDNDELRFLGRRHTARQSQEAVMMAREAGFANLSLDLMYGLPGQTLAAWKKNLATALTFKPEHLSCYQLTVEPGTELARRQGEGGKKLLDEEAERDLFLFTSTCLPEHGYLHYEISNFALGEEHLCRHNLKYWRRLPYLGLGPAAHSFDGVMRWWNHRSVARYCETLAAGAAPVAGSEVLTPEQVRLEKLWLGFRTREGVELSAVKGDNQAEEVLAALQRDGLLRVENGWAVPTLMGFLLADRLPLMVDN